MKYVIIRDASCQAPDGGSEQWQETRIFPGNATLDEVMTWAEEGPYQSKTHSNKRIQITRPHQDREPQQ